MEFLYDYGLFLAKTGTVVAAVAAIAGIIVAASKRGAAPDTLEVENLNRHFRRLGDTLKRAMANKAAAKALSKQRKQEAKSASKSTESKPKRFVIDFKGDLRASATDALRHEVSAVIAAADEGDDVIVRLENSGGVVHEHGLAASQLKRLRDASIPLTVVVDKVAASGGYLMACVANRIVAAPFAILGSIGVLAQLPNFNRLLDKHGVDFEQITAGKHKRTVTMFGRNTDEDRAKLREELEDIHTLFKSMVADYRRELDIDAVATGEYWYGSRALDLKLADELSTSDELLAKSVDDYDLYKVHYRLKQPLGRKLMQAADGLLGRLGLGQL
ncbi:MAG: protease SohB [Pseudomonadota bacterium]